MKRWLVFAVLALAGAGLDLWSKQVVLAKVPLHQEQVVIPGYFAFGHIYNEGIVFGKFQNAKSIWLIVSIIAVPVILAIFASVKNPKWILTVSLGLILGGTLGNLYDRAKFGKVRDFIKFSYMAGRAEHPWPLFNLADAYICAGVLLLSAEMVFFDEKKKKKLQDEKAARAAKAAAPVADALATAPTQPVQVTNIFCRDCGAPYGRDRDVCPHCGGGVKPQGIDPNAPTVHDGVKPVPCAKCGLPVDPRDRICAKCGSA